MTLRLHLAVNLPFADRCYLVIFSIIYTLCDFSIPNLALGM